MAVETTSIDTLVVGAGQAGVAMSEHLGKLGVPHLVLERSRIAERWRTGRWDSLVANGPHGTTAFRASNSTASIPMRSQRKTGSPTISKRMRASSTRRSAPASR